MTPSFPFAHADGWLRMRSVHPLFGALLRALASLSFAKIERTVTEGEWTSTRGSSFGAEGGLFLGERAVFEGGIYNGMEMEMTESEVQIT